MADVYWVIFRTSDSFVKEARGPIPQANYDALVPPANHEKTIAVQAEIEAYDNRPLGSVPTWNAAAAEGLRVEAPELRPIITFKQSGTIVNSVEYVHNPIGLKQALTIEGRNKDGVLLTGTINKSLPYIWNEQARIAKVQLVSGVGTINVPITKAGIAQVRTTELVRVRGVGNVVIPCFEVAIVVDSNGDLEF